MLIDLATTDAQTRHRTITWVCIPARRYSRCNASTLCLLPCQICWNQGKDIPLSGAGVYLSRCSTSADLESYMYSSIVEFGW